MRSGFVDFPVCISSPSLSGKPGGVKDVPATERLQICRPRLPTAEAIRPYLAEIDRNRWYTNFGPLVRRFERRLAKHFGVDPARVVCVANCTLGIVIALRARDVVAGGLCAVPSWTYIATASAVRLAGLVPWFLDVDQDTWQLHPDTVLAALQDAPGHVSAVVPVSPFGSPVDVEAWNAFEADRGIPVAIDAATGFDSAVAGNAPVAISLHATKALGIGEGGLVLAKDPRQAERIRRMCNFGLASDQRAACIGTNAKLSEYAGAVGLAALDAWPESRTHYQGSAKRYRAALTRLPGVTTAPGFGRRVVNSTCNIVLRQPAADRVISRLNAGEIGARQWWGKGCHRHPAYIDCPRTALLATEFLAERVIGLPYFPDITDTEIDLVVHSLAAALGESA